MAARRALVTLVAGAVLLGSGGWTVVTQLPAVGHAHRSAADIRPAHCTGEGPTPVVSPGAPVACAHADAPPKGVDVTKPVSTQVLEARDGAASQAVTAAAADGVASPAAMAEADGDVPCDGDGTSGYRVQAVYVVTADRTNRYPALVDDIRRWAAGVDAVVNRSAAKTGGVRDVRFVTGPADDGGCTPAVLNVTLPAGATSSFNATISAMLAAGWTNPARKYLMWVDGTGYCGIAQTYLDSRADQGNANNGSYPQFARIDQGCWGQGLSVEAHELLHTLGSVQNDAPHSTKVGHCWDESDRMCYADGGKYAMKQVCPADQEGLLDCDDDDYFSTYPPAGSYLATHWNSASSRFLIGGGDGSDGGTPGVATRLGATVAVNNPAVPGVATQVTAAPDAPAGRTTSVRWTTSRAGCAFADPSAEQTTLQCPVSTVTAVPVTATITDSTGEKVVRSTSLTFDRTARAAAAVQTLDGAGDPTYTACPTGRVVLGATVTDQVSGAPVLGVAVSWYRTTGTASPVKVATATTGMDGVARANAVTASAGSYAVRTTTAPAFATVSSPAAVVTVAPGQCATALTVGASSTTPMAGQTVTVSGALTRTPPGGDGTALAAAGEGVQLSYRPAGRTTWSSLRTVTTGADGSYSAALTFTGPGTLRALLPARTAYAGSTADLVDLAVGQWQTALTVDAADEVMASAATAVTGVLTQTDTAGQQVPKAGAAVSLTYPLAGGRTATTSVKTAADGRWTASVKPTGTGQLVARYAGAAGWAPAYAETDLTVDTWTTALTLSASVTDLMAGAPVTVSGSLQQTGLPGTLPVSGASVVVTYPVAGGRTATTTVRTTSSGTWAAIVRPTGSGAVLARYAGTTGWAPASASADLTVTAWSTALTLTGSTASVAAGGPVTLTGRLTQTGAPGTTGVSGAGVTLAYPLTLGRTGHVTVRTSSTGAFSVVVRPTASGTIGAAYAGAAGWDAAAAEPLTVQVG